MDNRTMHQLRLDPLQRAKVEEYANRSEATPPKSKPKRARRGWAKWWRKQLEASKGGR